MSMDDSRLEEILMGRLELKVPGDIKEARDFLEKLLLPGLAAHGRSAAEARSEAAKLVGEFGRLMYLKGASEGYDQK